MPKVAPFEKYPQRYEEWFKRYPFVYDAELRAIRELLPEEGIGLEVGVGTGRFAAPLGIRLGVEPSARMGEIARSRGINVLAGVAEELPLRSAALRYVLMVTTVCFVDDLQKSFEEAHRVLANRGFLIIGLVDRESPLGRIYSRHQRENVFYRDARFFSTEEIVTAMKQCAFTNFMFRQTLFADLCEITAGEPITPGHGTGSFVVVRGRKIGRSYSLKVV